MTPLRLWTRGRDHSRPWNSCAFLRQNSSGRSEGVEGELFFAAIPNRRVSIENIAKTASRGFRLVSLRGRVFIFGHGDPCADCARKTSADSSAFWLKLGIGVLLVIAASSCCARSPAPTRSSSPSWRSSSSRVVASTGSTSATSRPFSRHRGQDRGFFPSKGAYGAKQKTMPKGAP